MSKYYKLFHVSYYLFYLIMGAMSSHSLSGSSEHKHTGMRHNPENAGINFWFMRKIREACNFISSEEVYRHGNHDGRVYFWEWEEGVTMLKWKHIDTQKQKGIRVDRIILRTDFNYPGWPKMSWSTPVECIQIRWPKTFDSSYSLRKIETTSKMGNVRSLLADRRKEFSYRDVVENIEKLDALDVIFVHFEEDGQLYSITVAESSKQVNGKSYALCNVIYRVRDEKWKYHEAETQGIMHLPLKVGEKMRFVKNGSTLVKELGAHPIKKLQHKSLKQTEKKL